jgi:hypothetical protein
VEREGGGLGGGRAPGVGHSWPSVGPLNRRGWNSRTIYFKSIINSSIQPELNTEGLTYMYRLVGNRFLKEHWHGTSLPRSPADSRVVTTNEQKLCFNSWKIYRRTM